MNLETKITIYKFTPQVFTLTRPLPSGTGVIRTIRTRMLLPPSEELTTAITSKNITCPLPLYTGYGTIFLSPCPPTEASIR